MLRRYHSGFSLIELVVGLAIVALLIALGVPQYSTFISNSRLRVVTEGVANGLNIARAEAVKRNGRVELVFVDDEPIEALVNIMTPTATGANWVVREFVPTTNSYNFIEGKSGAEGTSRAGGAGVVITPVTAGVYNGTVTFNGFGAMNTGQTLTFQFTYPAAGLCAAAGGPLRCLNVVVSPGGQIRTCDPSVVTATDTRAC